MAEDRAAELATVQQYRAALESVEVWLARDPGAADVARTLERIVRFEIEHRIPEEERLASRIAAHGRTLPSRTAIISDIHGNHAGLVAALADIDRQGCDQIVCLGDLVDGGPDNEAVIETLQQRGIPCVRGNHDEINDVELPGAMRSFLLDLPERIVDSIAGEVDEVARQCGDRPLECQGFLERCPCAIAVFRLADRRHRCNQDGSARGLSLAQ